MKIIEKQFLTTGIVTVVVILIVMAAMLDHYFHRGDINRDGKLPLVVVLYLTGCLGGITVHYRRLQALPSDDASFEAIAPPYRFIVQSVVSPGLAGVFAVIAYLVFGGGILKGAVFPEFTGDTDGYDSHLKTFFALIPKTNKDVALMFLWAFLAGFSETFVPNLLDNLARHGHKDRS